MVREQDHTDRLAAHVGAMSLEIARIAAGRTSTESLDCRLADYLAIALGVDAVALFSRRARRRAGRSRSSLYMTALSARRGAQSESLARRLKSQAYRAFIASSVISRAQLLGASDGGLTPHHVVAVPLGGEHSWAVCAIEYAVSSDIRMADERAWLLAEVAPALALATRQAHLSEEAHRIEQRVAHRRTLYSVTSEAILTIGDDFVIREVNPAFARLSGWQESAAMGTACTEVLKCRDERKNLLCGTPRCPISLAFSAASDGDQPVCDLTWEAHGGRRCEVSASATLQRSERDAQVVLVARDVTALNAANRMRANFISMVSHELRTPLNSVNGFLEIVTDGQVGPLNERQLEFLNYARVSTQQLTTLVEDILFISKADSGLFTLRVGDVEVGKLIQQTVQSMQGAAEKAGVAIATAIGPNISVVHADELRLQQVLTNLLGNAIKFSPIGSVVTLSVECRGDEVVFSVADQGSGVPLEDYGRIFERFYQSEGAVRERSGGYGLGLAIAKLIAEHHSGRIWVESQPDQGATFYFTIPAS